ncbi:MAG: hypothetical protein RLZZ480_60 [Candidatus Parcubacteria bacterium]|jgi:hypothetical protein
MELPRSFLPRIESENDLRSLATREGSARIDALAQEEKERLFAWYNDNFAEIRRDERCDYLEEFIQNGLVSDVEARELIERMSNDEKERIGSFVAKVMDVVEWRETFQECFRSLEMWTQVECLSDLIERPEAFPVIAPFVSPGDKRLSFATERDGRSEQVSIDKYFYSSPSEVIPLFESLVTYFERHHDEVNRIRPDFGAQERTGFISTMLLEYPGYKDRLRSWVEIYVNEGKQLPLLPFVERLHTLGELSDIERKILYTPKNETWTETLFSGIGRGTVTDVASIEKGMHDVTDKKIDSSYIGSVLFEQQRPRENAIKKYNTLDKGIKREVKAISERFYVFREHITDVPDFLCGLCISGYPVLLELEQFGLTKQEVAGLFARTETEYSSPLRTFDGSDIVALIAFNKEHKDGPDLEEVLLRHVEVLLHRDRHDQNILTELVFNLHTIWPQLTKKVQDGLLQAINSTDASFWMFNPTFALEHVFDNGTDFVAAIATNPDQFFYEYQYTRHAVAHSTLSNEEKRVLLLSLEDAFCSILEQNPALILSPKQSALCESMLPRERLVEILRGLLTPFTPEYELRDLLYSKYIDELKEEAQNLIREESVFVRLATYGREVLEKVFGPTEFLDLLKKYFTKVSLDDLLSTSGGVSKFSSQEIREFIDLASIEGSETHLCELVVRLSKHESERAQRPGRIKDDMTHQESMRTLLKKQLEQASPHSYKTVSALETQIVEKAKRIKMLEQQLLEAVTAYSYEPELQIAKEALIEKCQKTPELVFKDDVIDVLEEQAYPFVKASVHEYCATHPEILKYSEYGSGFGKKIDTIVGRAEYAELLKKHSQYLVFQRQRTPGYCDFNYRQLPFELKEVFTSMDPFYTESNTLEADYYDTIIGRLQSMAYYPLVKDTLLRIATDQQETLGEQKEQIAPPQEFAELTLRVAALEHSPLALRFVSEIALLPQKEQLRVIELLFIATRYNFDDDLDGTTPSLREVVEHVESQLRERLATGLHIPEVLLTDAFSLRTLQAFSEFYETALKESPSGKEAFVTVLTALTEYPYADWKLWGGDVPKSDAEAAEQLTVMKREKLVPEQISLEAYRMWCEQSENAFDEVLTYEIGDVVEGVRQILDNAVADGHVTHEVVTGDASRLERELEMLMAPLKDITNTLQEYAEAVKGRKNSDTGSVETSGHSEDVETYRRLKEEQRTYREEYGDAIDTLTAKLYLNRLRNLSADELRSGAIRFMKKEVRFDRVFKVILEAFKDEFPGITEDLFRLQQTLVDGKTHVFGASKVSRKQLTITDKVDFDTAFHIGQYPVPSCQSFASTIGYNEGLLSYVSDPTTHIIQVWDEDQKLIARSVVRLMEDKEKQPALFAERIYSVNAHHKISEAIIAFAKQKAEKMGTKLYSSGDNFVAAKGVSTLFNSGTRSSATYSDAGQGFVRGGVFRISAAREV